MAEHQASVTVHAPVHQVYTLFTHFNDFPKFMSFVKEVTYYDEQRSHWVVQVLGEYEWDAVNEDWIPDRQVGWRSTRGLSNTGRVKFRPIGPDRTIVDVYICYIPPTGPLGELGETFGVNSYVDFLLQKELDHFARMVEQAPPGALDPMSSHYLFHNESAMTRGATTRRQRMAMERDPMMSAEALAERKARIEREAARQLQEQQEREAGRKQRVELERRATQELQAILMREAERRLQEQRARELALQEQTGQMREPDPVYDTLGGRNAALDRTALGDKDAIRTRHPRYEQDPMTARYPLKPRDPTQPLTNDVKLESPWFISIRGNPVRPE
jgi:hypothetical protein